MYGLLFIFFNIIVNGSKISIKLFDSILKISIVSCEKKLKEYFIRRNNIPDRSYTFFVNIIFLKLV